MNHALRKMRAFSGVFPSDLLPTHSPPGLIRYTVILNNDIHTEHGSHWVAVNIEMRYLSQYYYDSDYSRSSRPNESFSEPALCGAIILARRSVSPSTCADSTRFFALCMDQGMGPRQYFYLFGMEKERQVETAIEREFGRQHPRASGCIRGGHCCTCRKVV
jgi:hypothetical protein